MPTVPGYGLPKVSSQSMGAPKIRSYDSPLVGLGQEIQQAAGTGANIVIAEQKAAREKYDDAVENDWFQKLGDWEHQNIHDPNNEKAVKNLKGENYSPKVTDETLKAYDDFAKDLGSTAVDDKQKNRFAKLYVHRRQALRDELVRHENAQHEAVAKQKYDGATDVLIRDGANFFTNHEGKRDTARKDLIKKIEEHHAKEGTPAAEVEAEKLNKLTRFHLGILEKLKEVNPIEAEQYLASWGHEIDPNKVGEIRNKVNSEALATKGRALADKIQTDKGDKNFTEQYAELTRQREAGLIDRRVADVAEKELKNDQSVYEHNETKRQADLLGTVTGGIRQRVLQGKTELLNEETDGDFQNLNPAGKSAARALVLEFMNQRRTAASAATTAQKTSNTQALREFRERPIQEQAKYSDKFESLDEYAGVADQPTRKIMHAMARDAKLTVERGQELQHDEFMRLVKSVSIEVPQLRDDEDMREQFIARMVARRAEWRASNENKHPRQRDIDEMMAWELRYGDYGILGRNKFGFEIEKDDKTKFVPHAADEQPYEGNRLGGFEVKENEAPRNPKTGAQTKPLAVKPGFTAVTDGAQYRQVPSEQVDAWLADPRRKTWKKANP